RPAPPRAGAARHPQRSAAAGGWVFPTSSASLRASEPCRVPKGKICSLQCFASAARPAGGSGEKNIMKHVTCIEDLRLLHMKRVPKAFFDYTDRGSYTEDTLRANR